MTKATAIRASWYDYPQYYDSAYRSETRLEADFIEAACRRHCHHPVRRLLEPACGTGRLLRLLAARGYRMTGLDTCASALRYLDRGLTRRGLHATVVQADMANFYLAKPVDAAYCTVSSFLHLLSEDAAHRHLECVGRSLRPAGIYILGIELTPSDAPQHTAHRTPASPNPAGRITNDSPPQIYPATIKPVPFPDAISLILPAVGGLIPATIAASITLECLRYLTGATMENASAMI